MSEIADLKSYAVQTAEQARAASSELAVATRGRKDEWLQCSADLIRNRGTELIAANEQDLENAPAYGLSEAAIDRLRLTDSRIAGIAESVEQIVHLPDPVGEILDSNVRPNGLLVTRVSVPLGVVFFIYESRPNVTVDAAALCIKSGNAVILRGGKEAFHSNQAFHTILSDALQETGLPRHCVQLVQTTDRAAVGHFLGLRDLIDVAIPRGGKSLIERVAAEATMPVMKHFDGVCHVYVDRAADFETATRIIVNSKCQRPGVCNAAESLLVHVDVAGRFLPQAVAELTAAGVALRGCSRSREICSEIGPATEEDFRTEYLDLILSIKIVDSVDDAITHINHYGSHHTDAIITNDLATSKRFTARVDSAAVIVNASTRFNDGGEFGLGAEIGISTDKFHARGPCGLRELTSYKYVVHGDGQVRES